MRKQTIAGGERFVTPELKEYEEKVLTRRRAHPGARGRDLRGPARAGGGGGAARPAHGPRRRPRSTCWPPWPRWPAATTTSSRASRPGDELVLRGGPPPGHGAACWPSRSWPTTCAWASGAPRLFDPHRPQHGRQVHLPAPDRAHRADGADGLVRARARGQGRRGRPHLHPRGRHRPHPARPVDVHGRDAGDRPHPPPRHLAAAWSCWTRSAAAPPPSTGSPSPGRWPSTWPATRGAGPRRCSPRTTTS